MNAIHLPDLAYDCVGCGKSCTAFEVEIMPQEKPDLEARRGDSGRFFLLKQEDGRCSYLDAHTRCTIHERKPQTCRDFPFTAQPTPDGVFVGVSFLCTAVATGQGRPMEVHRDWLSERFGGAGETPERWPLWDDWAVDWPTYRQIEGYLQKHGLLVGATRLARAVRARDPGQLQLDTPAAPCEDLVDELLTLLETAGAGPEQVQIVLTAFQQKSSYASRLLGRTVDVSLLWQELPDWYAAQAQRYLEHLLFRKTLLEPPDVLSRVCLLSLIPQALEFLTRASADGRPIQTTHFERAVGLLEGRLMLHTRGMESFFSHLARQFLKRD